MARITVEDLEGETEVTIFPKMLTPEVNELLTPGSMIVVKGRVEMQEQTGRQIVAEEITSFTVARERFVRSVTVSLKSTGADDVVFHRLKEVFGKYPGLCRVNLLLTNGGGGDVILETKTGIKPTDSFIQDIEKLLGPECWHFGVRAAESSRS